MPGWMKHKTESRLPGEISIILYIRYADDITLMAESEEELKSLLMKVKEESQKAGLKLNIKKPRSGEGNGNPLQYSWPGKSHGQKSLAGYSLWGRKCWTWLSN